MNSSEISKDNEFDLNGAYDAIAGLVTENVSSLTAMSGNVVRLTSIVQSNAVVQAKQEIRINKDAKTRLDVDRGHAVAINMLIELVRDEVGEKKFVKKVKEIQARTPSAPQRR